MKQRKDIYKEMSMVQNYSKPIWCVWIKLLHIAIKLQTLFLPSQHMSSVALAWRDWLWPEETALFASLCSNKPSLAPQVPLWFRQFSTKRNQDLLCSFGHCYLEKNWRSNDSHPALAWVSTTGTKNKYQPSPCNSLCIHSSLGFVLCPVWSS